MTNNNSMTVITSKPFGSLSVDVYEDSKHEYYMTREQIGTALEYNNPMTAIKNIHQRNADRLDKFSTWLKTSQVEGNRTVERETIAYNLKGVMEICRFSRQPKADKFMDFCWDVMESLMHGDSVLATPRMDMAVTTEFIQAQFATLMAAQADLDHKMKYLNDKMDRTNEALKNTHSIEDEILEIVRQLKSEPDSEPEPNGEKVRYSGFGNKWKKEISDWRKALYEKIKFVSKVNEMETGDIMRSIYAYMTKNYTFVLEVERKKYVLDTGIVNNVSTIDVIEHSKMYSSIFETIVNTLYEEAMESQSKKKNKKNSIAVVNGLDNDHVIIDAEAKEVEPADEEKPKKQSDTAKYLTPVIEPLAIKLGDKTLHYHKTYRLVYETIGFAKMDNMMKAYCRAHGSMPKPKTKVFLESDKALKLFKKTVEELMKEN